MEIFDLLNEESVSGACSCRASPYKFNKKSTASVWKGKSTSKVPFITFWGSYTYIYKPTNIYTIKKKQQL